MQIGQPHHAKRSAKRTDREDIETRWKEPPLGSIGPLTHEWVTTLGRQPSAAARGAYARRQPSRWWGIRFGECRQHIPRVRTRLSTCKDLAGQPSWAVL